jgi:hypothetical protein
LALLVTALSVNAAAEIVVHQDKDGHITITNEGSSGLKNKPRGRKSRSGGTTYISSGSSKKAPAKYLPKIKKLSRQYGIKESLIIAVIRAESGFNPFAVSRKGAVGLMQLMIDTARHYGVVNRYNADQNLEAGVKHLAYLYKKYNYSLPLTLAAYNAGEEAVKKYKGIPPYKETRTYIKRVMAYMGLAYTPTTYSTGTKIYRYRTPDGKIMITDTYPRHAKGDVTVFE